MLILFSKCRPTMIRPIREWVLASLTISEFSFIVQVSYNKKETFDAKNQDWCCICRG